MDKISFQSGIRITGVTDYYRLINPDFTPVNYPWTIRETVISPKARSEGVYDCTVLGVTDGLKVLLFHLCPTVSLNKNLKKLEVQVIQKISELRNSEFLQGFILGGKDCTFNNKSMNLFNMLEGILNKLNIEYSKFKGGNFTNNVAYDSTKDEWIIGSDMFLKYNKPKESLFKTPKNAVDFIFDDVKIADCDELIW